MPETIEELVKQAIAAAQSAGALPEFEIEDYGLERPADTSNGDWSSTVAMRSARLARMAPAKIAKAIVDNMPPDPAITRVEVAGPGFINFYLSTSAHNEVFRTVREAGSDWGKSNVGDGLKVNYEFISANPTGPLHVGHGRWAALGDSMCNVFEHTNHKVTREYYFNDHGSQIDRFAKSLYARAMGREAPEDGYGGQYIADIAEKVRHDALQAGESDPITLPEDEAVEAFRARGVDLMFGEIKERLRDFRSEFDVFFHEDSLHESGAVARAIDTLRERGEVFDEDGAVWLRTTSYGDDKDRVLIKSDGQAAYFAGDVAYYLDKRNRGADSAIYLLGADHHGYIGRMMAMCQAFGDTPGVNMQILIGQMVNLLKNGAPVRMSKRAGTIVTLDDLVDVVGVDAARYALVRVSMDSNLDIDLDLLASHTNENPVYYVQYAHARTRNVARNAAEHGVNREAGFDPAALDTPAGAELLGVLAGFPAQVAQAAELREPHRLARYLEQLASAYHAWYGATRVTPRGDDAVDSGHVARLWLNDAVGQVLANGLDLLGVSAPERM